MDVSGQDGIQRLIAAEAEAQQIVARARQGKRPNPKALHLARVIRGHAGRKYHPFLGKK